MQSISVVLDSSSMHHQPFRDFLKSSSSTHVIRIAISVSVYRNFGMRLRYFILFLTYIPRLNVHCLKNPFIPQIHIPQIPLLALYKTFEDRAKSIASISSSCCSPCSFTLRRCLLISSLRKRRLRLETAENKGLFVPSGEANLPYSGETRFRRRLASVSHGARQVTPDVFPIKVGLGVRSFSLSRSSHPHPSRRLFADLAPMMLREIGWEYCPLGSLYRHRVRYVKEISRLTIL